MLLDIGNGRNKQDTVLVPEEFMFRKETCKPVITVFCEKFPTEANELWWILKIVGDGFNLTILRKSL